MQCITLPTMSIMASLSVSYIASLSEPTMSVSSSAYNYDLILRI